MEDLDIDPDVSAFLGILYDEDTFTDKTDFHSTVKMLKEINGAVNFLNDPTYMPKKFNSIISAIIDLPTSSALDIIIDNVCIARKNIELILPTIEHVETGVKRMTTAATTASQSPLTSITHIHSTLTYVSQLIRCAEVSYLKVKSAEPELLEGYLPALLQDEVNRFVATFVRWFINFAYNVILGHEDLCQHYCEVNQTDLLTTLLCSGMLPLHLAQKITDKYNISLSSTYRAYNRSFLRYLRKSTDVNVSDVDLLQNIKDGKTKQIGAYSATYTLPENVKELKSGFDQRLAALKTTKLISQNYMGHYLNQSYLTTVKRVYACFTPATNISVEPHIQDVAKFNRPEVAQNNLITVVKAWLTTASPQDLKLAKLLTTIRCKYLYFVSDEMLEYVAFYVHTIQVSKLNIEIGKDIISAGVADINQVNTINEVFGLNLSIDDKMRLRKLSYYKLNSKNITNAIYTFVTGINLDSFDTPGHQELYRAGAHIPSREHYILNKISQSNQSKYCKNRVDLLEQMYKVLPDILKKNPYLIICNVR